MRVLAGWFYGVGGGRRGRGGVMESGPIAGWR